MTCGVLVWRPGVKKDSAPVPATDLILRLVLDQEQTRVDWELWSGRTWWTIRAPSGAVSPQVIHHRRAGSTWVSWIRFSGCCHMEVQQVTRLMVYLVVTWWFTCGLPGKMLIILKTCCTLFVISQVTMETVWMTSLCFLPATCPRIVRKITSMWWIICFGKTHTLTQTPSL